MRWCDTANPAHVNRSDTKRPKYSGIEYDGCNTVYRERYVSAIFECTCDTSDGQSARTHLGHTYKKTGMIRAPFKVVAIDT